MFELAKYHNRFDIKLYKHVMNQDPRLVKSIATPEARKLYRMHREVGRSIHLNKGFTRFDISPHGILFAKKDFEHDVVDIIMHFFHTRYPKFVITIESKGKTYVIDPEGIISTFNQNLKKTVQLLEKKHPINPLLKELNYDETLWKEYYDSQFIRERKNLKLMQKMMPLKYRDFNAVETRMSKRTRNLSEFV